MNRVGISDVPELGPPSRVTARVLFVCWLAILFEGYDVGVMGAILPALAQDKAWSLTPLELGMLSSYAMIGMFFGALLVGMLSELLGRRRMLLLCVLVFSLMMAGAAWAPTPAWFGFFRFVGGLGLGGVIPVAAALTVEYSRAERRSFNYGLMYSGYSLGILCAAAAAIWLLPTQGWRGVIAVGVLPVLLLWPMARMLPESLEYLVGQGRTQEATRLATQLQMAVPELPAQPLSQQPAWQQVLAEVFARRHLRATACFWVALFCGLLLIYGLNTWLPTIMRQSGYDLGSSLGLLIMFSLASALGGLFLGRAADRFGVRAVVGVFYLVGALAIFALAARNSMALNYVLVAIAGLGSIGASLILTGHLADYYPPRVRAAATGWGLSFARFGAMSGPLLGGYVAGSGIGQAWNFIAFALVGLVAAVAVFLLPARPARLP
ncbi:MFS transporter, AAHS family, benzoate transport protein [Pseudomonas gessardii]|uniref:MFS transporter n=1 Tax=Pseudomonas TaxID=286 RepID=UPI000882C702|nr:MULTISPECIES: MFS transporter [Pseudomonas]MRU53506.1 MFS transporter [Pseudomonas gessardii]NNA70534.1 MFS transporter [Pseudomonas gessardii]ONH38510.1 MFS transporter [Pseudomonas gessardii]PHN61100.1 MFS transporter [Pseudomonas sp. ICMP 8385]SDQ42312.1 MFS transporter, AAHS family, benzoate transport protein [Pseudomonas gessardii]